MAGLSEDIVQRIALAGEGEVIAALGEIGKAGEEAFGTLASSLGTVGEALAGITIAVTGVGAAFGLWAKKAADVTVELSNLGTEIGTTIEETSAFKGALTSMGVDSDTLAYAFKRLSFRIESEWDAIKKSTKNAADTIINNNLAIRASQFGIIHAQESLRSARQALIELQGGDKVDPEIAAQHKLVDAVNKVKEAELKVAEARQKAHEASKKAAEDEANSIAKVSAAVGSVIAGLDNFAAASTKANLSFDNVLKGIIVDAEPAAASLDGFKNSIEGISQLAPESQAVFLRLSDFFHNSGNAALNAALSYKVFGRGVNQDLVATMTLGSKAILENEERLKSLGLTLNEVDKKNAFEFRRTFNALSYDLFTTFTQIGNLFGPAFVTGMKQLQTAVENNHTAIIEWASDVASRAKPVIEDFFDILTTGGKNLQTGWIKTIVDAFKNEVYPAIKGVANVTLSFFQVLNGQKPDVKWVGSFVDGLKQIKVALGSVWDGLDETVKKFNATFGTEFSTLAVVVMTGIGIKMGSALLAGVATTFNPVALAAVVAAALAVVGPDLGRWLDEKLGTAGVGAAGAARVKSRAEAPPAVPNAATFDTYFAPIKESATNLAGSVNQAADVIKAGSTKLVAAWELTGEAFIKAVNALGGPAKAAGVVGSQGAFIEAVNSGGGSAKAVKNTHFNAPISNLDSAGLPNQKVSGDLAALGTTAESTLTKFEDLWGSLEGLKSTVDGLAKVFSGLLSQQPSEGHAGGGIVRGPGTGTSDSILARVSRGEGIVRADGSNLMDIVRHFTGGFAIGGMIPRFALGGIVPAMAGGHYSVDLRTDKGTFRVQASEATARQLNRYAVDSRLVRTGPSPSWRT